MQTMKYHQNNFKLKHYCFYLQSKSSFQKHGNEFIEEMDIKLMNWRIDTLINFYFKV